MGIERFTKRFEQLRTLGKRAFIPFTVLGWPTPKASLSLIQALIHNGASCLELGFAFSDPAADGPVIQQAFSETLAQGVTVSDGLALIAQVRKVDPDIPIGVLVYYNLVLAYGLDRFLCDLAKSGGDGILVADVPCELAVAELEQACKTYQLAMVLMASPLTPPKRLEQITRHGSGFLYGVSRLGITGPEARFDPNLQTMIQTIQTHTDTPVCIGFGISTPQDVEEILAMGANGVITGSAVIQQAAKELPDSGYPKLGNYIGQMVAATAID